MNSRFSQSNSYAKNYLNEEPGLIIESNSCVGLLGRPGSRGKFVIGSEEMELSKKIVLCNICLDERFTSNTCLHDDTRERALVSIIEGVRGKEGRREGAKIYVSYYERANPEEYICHFHSFEEGEIDCH